MMVFNVWGKNLIKQIAINVKELGVVGDGVTDDTYALQSAIDSNKYIFIPEGTYLFHRTLIVPEGRHIFGTNNTVLRLTATNQLIQNEWRTTSRYPYLYVAGDCILDTITINGCDTIDYRNHNAIEIHGDNTICKNISTYNTNYFPDAWRDNTFDDPESESGYLPSMDMKAATPGFGIFVYNANHVKILGSKFINNGYQGIGTENANDVLIDGCYVGNSLRTGIQIHRGSHNIRVCNCTVDNQFIYKHADITFHGSDTSPISNVVIDKCSCTSQIERTGVVQTVWGFESEVVVSNCVFKAKKRCIYIHSRGYESELDADTTRASKWIITNNILESLDTGIKIKANDSLISNNVLECGENKIVEDGNNIIKSSNVLIDVPND